jgi:hypothetical protein
MTDGLRPDKQDRFGGPGDNRLYHSAKAPSGFKDPSVGGQYDELHAGLTSRLQDGLDWATRVAPNLDCVSVLRIDSQSLPQVSFWSCRAGDVKDLQPGLDLVRNCPGQG